MLSSREHTAQTPDGSAEVPVLPVHSTGGVLQGSVRERGAEGERGGQVQKYSNFLHLLVDV